MAPDPGSGTLKIWKKNPDFLLKRTDPDPVQIFRIRIRPDQKVSELTGSTILVGGTSKKIRDGHR
jgi:hypothetical protein